MREFKFDLIFKTKIGLRHKKYALDTLMLGLEKICDCHNYEIIAKRQYTGLKDKNGKEIYEGDIMMLTDSDMLFVVKYNLNKFVLDGCVTLDEAQYFYERKVIGNIYENADLLK